MREFIVRARKAPVDADRFLASRGTGAHVEYLAQIITNALFVSKGHRHDTRLTLVLEDSHDYSRAMTFDGSALGTLSALGSLSGLHEQSLLQTCANALRQAANLKKEASVVTDEGIVVTAVSFEHLVKAKSTEHSVYMLDKKGADIRDCEIADDPVFLLTDHIPMPKKSFKSLARQGVIKVSLGPVMLHASQCVSIIHNELDRMT